MKVIIATLLSLSVCADVAGSEKMTLAAACAADNDLFRVLSANEIACNRFDSVEAAMRAAEGGSGVMILADGYPAETTVISRAAWDEAAKKNLRLYVEYPSALPSIEVGGPTSTKVERIVVSSDLLGDRLEELRIVSINGLHYVPVKAERPHLVSTRVAGFDRAVFGLPENTSPILFEMPSGNALVATTKLSGFVTGRYAPQNAWRNIWCEILSWLAPGTEFRTLEWTPTVRATYTRDERLPGGYELQAIKRGIQWYKKANMIIHPSFAEHVVGKTWVESVTTDAPMGDGTLGGMEAVLSVIHQDGSQRISSVQRGDCICETAMAMAFAGRILEDETSTAVARNLLDYYLFQTEARKRERGDPEHGAYGLIAWGVTNDAWYKANYGDDNARQMMGTLATAALTGEHRWDEAMMMCLLANLRTTGQFGFRGNRIDVAALGSGWKPYFQRRPVNYAPHFEAYLWACYLWAYGQTGDPMFLDRAETALKMTMAQHTDGWRWTNGLAQERARIVLPLAWLVRVKNTPETRAMLREAVDGLLTLQVECGAIREELGLPGRGVYPPPRSNAAYGTNEASLIAENGDPVSDLLYTTNFAFLALHEAAAATGDEEIVQAEDRLAEFLCRIQVKSDTQPTVDGGWFRAFDFGRWEHWGCNADHGWGAWAIESGWTQGWIVSVLAMRQMNTSLWDLTSDSRIERHHDRLRKQMIPDEALQAPDVRAAAEARAVRHGAVGKAVELAVLPSPHYFALGAKSLVDGKVSNPNHMSGMWLGFHRDDLKATIDLGQTQTVGRIAARFLKSTPVGIHLPTEVRVEVSDHGKQYRTVAVVQPEARDEAGPLVKTIQFEQFDARGRYVRVVAKNIATIPAGHPAAGRKAWLFVDEILIDPVSAESGGGEKP